MIDSQASNCLCCDWTFAAHSPNDIFICSPQIMSRLARLEAELAEERLKREAAEAEMHSLLAFTSQPHYGQTSRR